MSVANSVYATIFKKYIKQKWPKKQGKTHNSRKTE